MDAEMFKLCKVLLLTLGKVSKIWLCLSIAANKLSFANKILVEFNSWFSVILFLTF